jgi:ATP-dependent DNA ligase
VVIVSAAPRFDLGQERRPVFFYEFALPRLKGKDRQSLPIEERKAKLEELGTADRRDPVFNEFQNGNRRALGAGGVLGLRLDRQTHRSHYEARKRSRACAKIKLCQEQEFVIGGMVTRYPRRHPVQSGQILNASV